MPPAKARPIAQQDDARSESSATRERVVTLVSNGRKGKATTTVAAVAQNNTSRDAGSGLKELLLVSNENGEVIAPGQSGGVSKYSLGRTASLMHGCADLLEHHALRDA